jgi:hypothetical protein
MGYLIDITLGACGSLVAAEIWSHADPLSRWLIRRAVLSLPEAQRARREEEWLAHLEETPGAVRKLLHAVGCWSGAPAVGYAAVGQVRQSAGALSAVFKSGLTVKPYWPGRATVLFLLGSVGGAAMYCAGRIMLYAPLPNSWVLMVLGGIAGASIYASLRLSYEFSRGR